MYADYHVHTEYSNDSFYPMEKVVKDAINLGLDEICFTDHVDYGTKTDWDDKEHLTYRRLDPKYELTAPWLNVDYPKYFEEIKRLQEKFKDIISIKKGLEFGVQRHTISKYNSLYEKYDFDFILLSVHQIDNQEFYVQDYQKGKTQKEYVEGYYNEILYLVKNFQNYSVLAHLDLINRYDLNGEYPFERLESIITEILKETIKNGKGIEVNTSYIRYGLKDTCPSRNILKLYKDLGGRIITIGSDSHKEEHLGKGIKEAKELLKNLGYKEYCTFEKMVPIFHEL